MILKRSKEEEKLVDLEKKYNLLYELYVEQKQQLRVHEELLIKSAKLFRAIDQTLLPISEHYRKEFEKQQAEKDSKLYG